MKFISVIIFILICSPVYSAESNIYVSACTKNAEKLFKQYVKPRSEMVFTHVPRGLIVSIDEAVFFEPNQEKLKLESLYVLNEIGFVLNKLENNFVIEGHTESIDPINSIYNANWELSLARANNITKYLMRCAKVSPEKLFTVGFGEFMPFVGNVSEQNGIDNRIDFVILDYEASR